jgi:hypothetical protein
VHETLLCDEDVAERKCVGQQSRRVVLKKTSGRKNCLCEAKIYPTEGQKRDKVKELKQGSEEVEFLPSRTSRWYACQYHRTCRSNGLL